MARISQEEIDRVRSQADIVDVIGHYLQITRKGRSFTAVCPFHDDHSPSLSISPDRQIYKCFVCGNGGNVFTFVQNYEKVSFPEAVGRVASLIGYSLSVQPDSYQRPKDPHKEALHTVLSETIRYTMYEMDSSAGTDARGYLAKRGLDDSVLKHFEIGWHPGGDVLYRFLHAKGYEDRDLVGANVVRATPSGMHDVFSGRITFPIHDSYGNPIGFSARSMDPAAQSKYINTNETDIFTKGDIVYNAHRARTAARKAGCVLVCEGVTDVIAFWRAGIENVVCTLGTACTPKQISLLKGLAARIVFCYDGDEAGRAATVKAINLAREAGARVSVIVNRTGKDPDEIIRDMGQEALRKLADQEEHWMEFMLEYHKDRTNLESYLEKKELVEKMQKLIASMDDETDRSYFTGELARLTGFNLQTQTAKPKPEAAQPLKKLVVPDGTLEAEKMILAMMLNSPAAVRKFEEDLGYLTEGSHQELAMMIVNQVRSKGETDVNALIDAAEQQTIRNLITDLLSHPAYENPYDENVLNGAIRKVKISVLETEADAYRDQLRSDLNPKSMALILEKYSDCLRELRRYIDEENNS
ncbi:MAG: DNA primase [Erysipelotrichaceae bacterium]|nr:DNA primase [Erysipelotrichaceae bacterium]